MPTEAPTGHQACVKIRTTTAFLPDRQVTAARPEPEVAAAAALTQQSLARQESHPSSCSAHNTLAAEYGRLARHFVQACPTFFRERLEKALDTGDLHQYLSLWRSELPPGSAHRTELESLADQNLSSHQLFWLLLQQRLGTDRFSAHNLLCLSPCPDVSSYQGVSPGRLASSPDGRYWAHKIRLASGEMQLFVNTGHSDASTLLSTIRPVQPAAAAPEFHALTFRPDSRSLQALDNQGLLHRWEPRASHWECTATSRLCSAPVRHAVASPDGRYLALVTSDPGLSIFHETPTGQWQRHYHRCWSADEKSAAGHDPELVTAVFSQDSRVFLFATWSQAFVCRRSLACWHSQWLGAQGVQQVAGALAAGGQKLALFSVPRRHRLLENPSETAGTMSLWHCEGQQQWHPVTSHTGRCSLPGYCMAFSPDSQQLAFPRRWSVLDNRLCILSATSTPPWRVPQELKLTSQPRTVSERDHLVDSVQFSLTGSFLAAAARSGIDIWRRHTDGNWTPVAWVAARGAQGSEPVLAVFSPDDHHCALATGPRGEVSVWGPGADGRYRRKLYVHQNVPVQALQFTPDGSRLLVGAAGYDLCAHKARAPMACLFLAPESLSLADAMTDLRASDASLSDATELADNGSDTSHVSSS